MDLFEPNLRSMKRETVNYHEANCSSRLGCRLRVSAFIVRDDACGSNKDASA